MANLALICGIFFIAVSVLLLWLSRVIHPDLSHDAALGAVFSLASLGLNAAFRHGLDQGANLFWRLLLMG